MHIIICMYIIASPHCLLTHFTALGARSLRGGHGFHEPCPVKGGHVPQLGGVTKGAAQAVQLEP